MSSPPALHVWWIIDNYLRVYPLLAKFPSVRLGSGECGLTWEGRQIAVPSQDSRAHQDLDPELVHLLHLLMFTGTLEILIFRFYVIFI